jgi:signal peptidase II
MFSRIALATILGGALGNLIDRIRLGEVTDFIDVGIATYRWPIFNVADSAVSTGMVILIALVLFEGDKTEPAEGPEPKTYLPKE